MPKLFTVSMTSSLKLAPRSKDQGQGPSHMESFAKLLDNPGAVRMLGHVAMKDTPSIIITGTGSSFTRHSMRYSYMEDSPDRILGSSS